MVASGARGDRGRQTIAVIPPFPRGLEEPSLLPRVTTLGVPCTTMLAQREVALACLSSQDRLGRGVDAHTAEATLDKGFPLALCWVASRGGRTRRWVLVSRYVACSCGPS